MKKWALLTVLHYLLVLLVLTLPLLLLGGLKWSGQEGWEATIDFEKGLSMYAEWGYWLWLGVMLAGQALLLLAPIGVAERRLPPRRPLLVPMIATAFFLANLCFAGGVAILCAAMGDDAYKPFGFVGELTANAPFLSTLWRQLGLAPKDEFFGWMCLAGTVVFLWLLWGLIFYRFARNDDPDALVRRSTRWLLRGSILELLVAVPSHIIVRGRNDCCASGGTFWGLTMGFSVMVMAFGPGVFFLFVERCARLRPKTNRSEGVVE